MLINHWRTFATMTVILMSLSAVVEAQKDRTLWCLDRKCDIQTIPKADCVTYAFDRGNCSSCQIEYCDQKILPGTTLCEVYTCSKFSPNKDSEKTKVAALSITVWTMVWISLTSSVIFILKLLGFRLKYELYRLQPLNNEEGSGPDLPHQTLDQSTPDLHGFVNQNLHN